MTAPLARMEQEAGINDALESALDEHRDDRGHGHGGRGQQDEKSRGDKMNQ